MALTLMSMLSVQAAETPNSEVVYFKEHVLIENGQMLTIDSVAYLINNKYGEKLVPVAYDKINKLKIFKAWVEDAKGQFVGLLPKKAFEDRNRYQESSLYNDERERVCSTNYPFYPHRFVYTSTVVAKSFVNLTHLEPQSTLSKPFHLLELWIHRPTNYPVQTLVKGLMLVSEDTVNQQLITRYTLKPTTVSDDASNNPAIVEKPSIIWVVPEQFDYGLKGSSMSWSEFGNWVDQLNAGLLELPEIEKSNVRNMVSGMKDTVDMVRVLYHYMQNHTRYVDVTLGIGGFKSYPAAYVSVNKFGDCKALSNYMKALLECVGISSHFVLVYRDENPGIFYPEFPTSQFNHVMLVVPVGRDSIWLENTSTTGAMGYVDVSTQNRPVLLLDGKNSRLIRTPSLSINAVVGRRRIRVKCSPEGDATILVNHQGRGWEYEDMNALAKDVSAKYQFNYLDRFIQFKHYEMLHFGFLPVNRDSMYASLEIAFRMPGFLQTTQDRVLLPQIPVYKGSLSFTKPDNQTLCFTIPVYETDTVTYQLSENHLLDNLPEPVSMKCPFGEYTSVFTMTGNQLIGVKTFFVRDGTYEPDAYRILYDFIQKVTESEKKSIMLK